MRYLQVPLALAVSLGVRHASKFLQLVGLTLIVVIDPDSDLNPMGPGSAATNLRFPTA
jgi:hypothetical protein